MENMYDRLIKLSVDLEVEREKSVFYAQMIREMAGDGDFTRFFILEIEKAFGIVGNHEYYLIESKKRIEELENKLKEIEKMIHNLKID